MNATTDVLDVRGLSCGYGASVVVRNLDLRVAPGEVIALLGANGAGKTTTLLTIAGVLPAIRGEVLLDGVRVERWPAPRIARHGVVSVPDDRGLFPKLTVRENLQLARRRRSTDALDLFPELKTRLGTPAGLLSGGQQQMLAIARALARDPRLLLIDELSFGLAPIAVQRLLPTVRSVADETGAAVLLVEQHVHLGLSIAERAYVLSHGSIALSGTAAELQDDATLLQASYLGADDPGKDKRMIQSTMSDFPLTINAILRHGRRIHATSECVTFSGDGVRRSSYGEVADNADRLAAALARLGIRPGDAVGTFMWNNQEHLEAYFAVPCMGAVLHTLNIRLSHEQLVYVTNHAGDRVVIVDASLLSVIGAVASELTSVEAWIVVGDGDTSALEATGRPVYRYDELLAAESPGFAYTEPDENAAAAMCYTSGTTGEPKGVVYSHRSTYLHSITGCTPAVIGADASDRILAIVPQFHANGWGLPYLAFLSGASLLMPGRFLQAEPLCRFIAAERPTVSSAVPTVWADVFRYGTDHEIDLSSLRVVVCGGSALPRSLMERFQERDGLRLIQGWGMTETSPVGTVGHPPADARPGSTEDMEWRAKSGRVVPGVELRIVDDDGHELAWDGESVGELEVRGPWVTTSYWRDAAPEKFHDGWLRTGDVGTLTSNGYLQITDRAKDVIKSGGEWISSVELENALMAHPAVVEAAVIGIPDQRWDERPLACVVADADVNPKDLKEFLADRVAKWQVPDTWAFVDGIPKTSVGKFDKKLLRTQYEKGDLTPERV